LKEQRPVGRTVRPVPGKPEHATTGPVIEDVIVMGKIVGAFGIQGWVRVHPYSDDPGSLAQFREWMLGQVEQGIPWRQTKIAEAAVHGRSLVARLEGVADRDAAERMNGTEIAVLRTALPPAAAGEFYLKDLEGLAVVNDVGEGLGAVAEVFSNGGQEVLRVTGADNERLIPFVDAYVKSVDLASKRILVDWHRDW
jgi:16S rRNA processing protein RimM